MAENPVSTSPAKTLQSPTSGGDAIPLPTPQNPNLSSPQIAPSPSMELPQVASPQITTATALDFASKQQQQQQQMQQQGLMSPSAGGFQASPGLQRSGSVPRISQIQQQFGAAAANNLMRQHMGMYGGQMSFGGGGSQIQQQQQQQQLSRAGVGMMKQSGQLQSIAGQTGSHFNLQPQMITQQRQKMSLAQGTQLHSANSTGQALQGMQTIGMMNQLGLNPQLRPNGSLSYGQQRLTHGQMRQQPLSQQAPLTSPQKLPGQNLQRTPSVAAINSQLSGLTQNGQSAIGQTTLSQQQWLKQMQPSIPGPVSPSYNLQQQRQQQAFLPQQLSSSQMHPKSMSLNHQQISQLLQQQPQLSSQHHQAQQHLLQQQLQHMSSMQQQQQQQQQQQLSPRKPGSAFQKSIGLTSQPDTPASGVTNGGSSSQGAEASNQLLGKRKIQDLVSQVDPLAKLDHGVEDLLLEFSDEFIDSALAFGCALAKHRKSSTLEAKDLLLHLEKNWHLTIPGYSREETIHQRDSPAIDVHKRRLEAVRSLMEPQQSEIDTACGAAERRVSSDSVADRPMKPSPSSEQLVPPAAASQMLHRAVRF